ncbi:MAG: hypothetical protein HY423_03695 [Candidatus Lambdaproteobacteria bacterium]|nr:hypothetical protein [Candidatus Lambdaproteobacteria bacterium]
MLRRLREFHPLKTLHPFWQAGLSTARAYEATLRRLLGEGFADMTPAGREAAIDHIVQAAAAASLVVAPLPYAELPIQAAMVRAIARVHGVDAREPLLAHVLGALAGGLALRQLLRIVPVFGALPHLSRVYGATWALGYAAERYCASRASRARGLAPEQPPAEVLGEGAAAQARESAAWPGLAGPVLAEIEQRLRAVDALYHRGALTESEYLHKRAELLATV